MSLFEQLSQLCSENKIIIHYDILPYDYTGMLVQLKECPDIIVLDSALSKPEQTVILAEHLGYFFTCKCSDTQIIHNMKNSYRQRAKAWAYTYLLPLSKFINAMDNGIRDKKQLAAFCELPEKFIFEAVGFYKEKYGPYARQGSYAIFFEPLGILRFF